MIWDGDSGGDDDDGDNDHDGDACPIFGCCCGVIPPKIPLFWLDNLNTPKASYESRQKSRHFGGIGISYRTHGTTVSHIQATGNQ